MAKTEKITDSLVVNMLRANGYIDGNFKPLKKNVSVWANRSENKAIDALLSTASKKRTEKPGYPEFIIYDEKNNIVIVIEDKRDTKFHRYSKIDERVADYAVNGALWYASFLKDTFDVIAIGISGTTIEEIQIDNYMWKKGAETFSNLNVRKILKIEEYRDVVKKLERNIRSIQELKTLTAKAKEINEFLRDYLGVIENKRLYVLGSILYALEDPAFKMAYSAFNNNADLSNFLYSTIERKIKNSGLQNVQIIQDELKPAIEGLARAEKEGAKQEYPNGTLLQLISDVDSTLYDYYKNSELDLISIFFNVFLSYSTSGGSDLGIVLTPSHITKLFVRIAEVTNESKILDPCAGTGGFLTSAWKHISLNERYTFSQKEKFRKNNLFGVEKDPTIYTIVALNMFLNKDGRSHIYNNDCFSLEEELKSKECNVGFINPPYSDEVYPEIRFVELMLDCLLPDSIGVAVVPVNAVSSRTKKHTGIDAIKARILKKHKLVASIQMPTQLFYPKGTETIVLVFQTGCEHCGDTWFATYDDGYRLIKQQKVPTPTNVSDAKQNELLDAYFERKETAFSFNKKVTAADQWVYTLHKKNDYTFGIDELQRSVNDYLAYLIQNRYLLIPETREKQTIPEKCLQKFLLTDYFSITPTKQKDKIQVNISTVEKNDAVPFVGRKSTNNGISDYIEYDPACINEGRVLTLALDGSTGSTFYQHHSFASGQNIWTLLPNREKIRDFSPEVALYLKTTVSQAVLDYSYNLSLTKTRLQNIEILLPVLENGEVDVDYIRAMMSNVTNIEYVREVQDKRY